jgi:hypothetical protein
MCRVVALRAAFVVWPKVSRALVLDHVLTNKPSGRATQ